MAKPKEEKPPKKIRYLLEMSEEQHYLIKLKAMNKKVTMKELIINSAINA